MSSRFPSTRADAAREIVAKGGITIDGDAIVVPSTDGHRKYRVRKIGDRVVCSCLDYVNRQQDCKHIEAAKLFVIEQAEMSKA